MKKCTHTTHAQFIQSSALGAISAVLPFQAVSADLSPQQPNIIFIMVDDMGYRNLGCYGSTTIQTPN